MNNMISARWFVLLVFLLSGCASASGGGLLGGGGLKSESLADGALLMRPDSGGNHPVVIFLPYTGGTASELFERSRGRLAALANERGLAYILIAGRGHADDYSSGEAWSETVQLYENRALAAVREAAADGRINAERAALAGYSMGGDLAWALSQRQPQAWKGALVMGSRASYRGGKNTAKQLIARNARYWLFMGSDERADRMAGMNDALAWLKRSAIPHAYERASGAHISAPDDQLAEGIRYVFEMP